MSNILLPPDIRPRRFKYRYSPTAAAAELHIPATLIYALIVLRKLRKRLYLGRVYIRMEALLHLLNENTLLDAFHATGDRISDPEGVRIIRRFVRHFSPDLATIDALAEASDDLR